MSGTTQNRRVGLVFVCVGVTLALVGSVVADGLPAVLIYACAAAVVILGILLVVRGGQR